MSERDITAHMNGQDIGPSKRLIVRIENERGDTAPIASGTIRDLRDQWRLEGIRLGLEAAAQAAHNGCLVPPDGGSPTEAEIVLCDEIETRIRAINPTDVLKGGE